MDPRMAAKGAFTLGKTCRSAFNFLPNCVPLGLADVAAGFDRKGGDALIAKLEGAVDSLDGPGGMG